ncbi:unnamed protein product, partial [marine sediment metagenome]
LYSYYYRITAPELTPELVKMALDVILAHFPEITNMVLWGEPLKEDVEFSLKFREPSEFIGKPHDEFLVQIENFAASHYVYLDLLEVAIFLPRFPWWLWLCFLGIAGVAVGTAVKEKKGG